MRAVSNDSWIKSLTLHLDEDAVVWGIVRKPSNLPHPILREVEAGLVSISVGEGMKSQVIVEAATAEAALLYKDMVEGILAFGRLQGRMPQLSDIARDTALTIDDREVKISCQLSRDQARPLLANVSQLARQHRAASRSRP